MLAVALLTKPILLWLNGFTVDWASANLDTASGALAIALGVGMLLVSAAIAALAGWVVCRLARALTAGR